jgi:hypothetical protein
MILMRNGRPRSSKSCSNTHLDEPGCATQESIKFAAKHRILIPNRPVDVRRFKCSGKRKDFQFPTCSRAFPGGCGARVCLPQIASEAEAHARQPGSEIPSMSVYNVDL